MNQHASRALPLLLAAVLTAPALRSGVRDARVTAPFDTTMCSEVVLYGRLVVIDPRLGTFVLQGDDEEFVAPPTIDVSILDGLLVRVDFDDACNVRTVVGAQLLAGPTIET